MSDLIIPVPSPEPVTDAYHVTNNLPYLIAVVLMTALGVASTVAIMVYRPDKDNAALIASIAGFIAPTTMALLAFMKTQETHVLVNGRMDEFKRLMQANAAATAEQARQKGLGQGAALKGTVSA